MKAWHHLPDLYFLHIPKTAGTSVRAWAEGLFPADAILPAHHLKQLDELPDEAIRRARFASGHFGWSYVDRANAAGKTPEVFTFLREMVSLRMSMLGYAKQLPNSAFDHVSDVVAGSMKDVLAAAEDVRMIEFVTSENINIEAQLARDPAHSRRVNLFLLYLAGAGNQSDTPVEATPATFAVATERLENMLAAGVVEDMAGSFAILCDRLGLPYLPLGATLNKSEKKLKPSAAYSELVRRRNPYSVQLHKQAIDLVAERKADLLTSYGVNRVDDLAIPMRAAFLTTDRGVERVREADITMADGLVTEGFAPRFFFDEYKRWLRWAGREATLYLPLDRSADRAIRFEVATTMSDTIRDGLTLSVDGQDIPLTRTYEQWPDGWHLICEATIPAGDAGLQYTALDFEAPEDVATEHPDSMGVRAAWALADVMVG